MLRGQKTCQSMYADVMVTQVLKGGFVFWSSRWRGSNGFDVDGERQVLNLESCWYWIILVIDVS